MPIIVLLKKHNINYKKYCFFKLEFLQFWSFNCRNEKKKIILKKLKNSTSKRVLHTLYILFFTYFVYKKKYF